jgi:protein-disulfide isomerase
MNGADFDRTWIEMMIEHHRGAISQSETVKTEGSNPDVLALADQIITAQQAEIAEMDLRTRQSGIGGVPFFIFNEKIAVSGAQGAPVLLDALAQSRPST